jgi:hypothetical protein
MAFCSTSLPLVLAVMYCGGWYLVTRSSLLALQALVSLAALAAPGCGVDCMHGWHIQHDPWCQTWCLSLMDSPHLLLHP